MKNTINYILITCLILGSFLSTTAQTTYTDENGRIRVQTETAPNNPIPQQNISTSNSTDANKIGEGWDKDFGRYEVGGGNEHTGHAELDEVYHQLQDVEAELATFKLLETELRTELERVKLNLAMCCNSNDVNLNASSTAFLMQNNPNPFQNSSSISYFIPENAANAQLQIRDINGKILQTFALKEPGLGQLNLDRSGLETGSYVYTLEIDGKMVDSKMMIVVGE